MKNKKTTISVKLNKIQIQLLDYYDNLLVKNIHCGDKLSESMNMHIIYRMNEVMKKHKTVKMLQCCIYYLVGHHRIIETAFGS